MAKIIENMIKNNININEYINGVKNEEILELMF